MYTTIAFFFSSPLFHPVSLNVQVLSFLFSFCQLLRRFSSLREIVTIHFRYPASKRTLRIDFYKFFFVSPLCSVCYGVEPLTSPSCVCVRWTRPNCRVQFILLLLASFFISPLFPRAILWGPLFPFVGDHGIVNEAVQVDITYC
jgi:hypothetical protein